ncbi:hypothetical protein FGK63_05245 [Ruegeria sediminis]|uniref:Uncharacterized protein n=1 Tax=Ruegeria sediminis TaxID=2583820 RepID=A0ABY2X100_9RHOB|nr:hypothetical protein [Ruegeria sediminis]TMV08534.1 hypothetical protein FGK63_05245 [Ruegeria sediminis]
MDISTDLVVKLIALITTLVGLYKVANIKIAEPLLVQITAALSILLVPAVMLGLLLMMQTFQDMVGRSNRADIDVNASDAEIMYQISKKFWNQSLRQKVLHLTIDKALDTGRYDVVVKAAGELNPPDQSDEVLLRAAEQLSKDSSK